MSHAPDLALGCDAWRVRLRSARSVDHLGHIQEALETSRVVDVQDMLQSLHHGWRRTRAGLQLLRIHLIARDI